MWLSGQSNYIKGYPDKVLGCVILLNQHAVPLYNLTMPTRVEPLLLRYLGTLLQ